MAEHFDSWLSAEGSALQRPYVIAEIGVNHDGQVSVAHDLIDVASAAGADCAKFQVFHSKSVVAVDARTAEYQRSATQKDRQFEMISNLELPDACWAELKDHCGEAGIDFLATAFDAASLELVDGLNPPAHKVASGEITNLPYLRQVASCGRTVLMSTGMASTSEVQTALRALGPDVTTVLMHCISAYPTPWTKANLLSIPHLREATRRPVGWSDHTIGVRSALMALALGSRIFEKHITLDNSAHGPDHTASADPDDFAEYVQSLSDGLLALGSLEKRLTAIEEPTIGLVRRSWHARRDIPVGRVIGGDDLIALRPESGISTIHDLTGRTALSTIAAGQPVTADDVR